jgi:hypothetical protein
VSSVPAYLPQRLAQLDVDLPLLVHSLPQYLGGLTQILSRPPLLLENHPEQFALLT